MNIAQRIEEIMREHAGKYSSYVPKAWIQFITPQILSLLVSELPKEESIEDLKPIADDDSECWEELHKRIGYNQCLKDIRTKIMEE